VAERTASANDHWNRQQHGRRRPLHEHAKSRERCAANEAARVAALAVNPTAERNDRAERRERKQSVKVGESRTEESVDARSSSEARRPSATCRLEAWR
jgi:hypothetical protein